MFTESTNHFKNDKWWRKNRIPITERLLIF